MKLSEKDISFGGKTFIINNYRSIFWPEKNILLLADIHIGKAAHFRKNGIAIPNKVGQEDLKRLDKILHHYPAKEVVIVGDILHSNINSEVEKFKEWLLQRENISFTLVKGNHDRLKDLEWKNLGIHQVLTSYHFENIQMIHQPNNEHSDNTFFICGHIHPGIELQTLHRSKLRLPCFVKTQNQLILPAFSLFTGLDTMTLKEEAQYYVITDQHIIDM